ncbi:RhuM family protein [Leucobacter sp. HY1910]
MTEQSQANERTAGEVVSYIRDDGSPAFDVRLENETLWLSQQQIAELFQTTRENITIHLRNVFDEGELDDQATSKDFLQVRNEGSRTVRRQVRHYNLDAILSVGYRVKSKTATQFRIWASGVLRSYLIEGVAVNERRLHELGQVVQILARSSDELIAGVAEVVAGYLPGLTLLRDYDNARLAAQPRAVPGWQLTLEGARAVVAQVAAEFPADALLGRERGDALAGIVATIYQGFAGLELYPTVEEKAANLLYLIVKDHPLSDGNKRSAAALFVTFLAHNEALHDAAGRARVSNNALAAITLLVAMSDPKEKELMVELIIRMLTEEGR